MEKSHMCKNGKYLGSFIDDSVITCDEMVDVEETKTVTNTKYKIFILYVHFY